jgi:hypothetical protein
MRTKYSTMWKSVWGPPLESCEASSGLDMEREFRWRAAMGRLQHRSPFYQLSALFYVIMITGIL